MFSLKADFDILLHKKNFESIKFIKKNCLQILQKIFRKIGLFNRSDVFKKILYEEIPLMFNERLNTGLICA